MSETTIAAITVTLGLFAQIILQVMTKLEAAKVAAQAKTDAIKAQQAAAAAAGEVAQVRTALARNEITQVEKKEKLETIAQTTKSVHILVNNAMREQLKLNAELSRWKANQTGNGVDQEAADLAERLLREHDDKQASVNRTS